MRGSRLVSSYRSNYAGYIARAFGLWGYPVTSPYSEPGSGSSFDRGVDILHEVAEFGPIGTEPHLLEAVELGASDLARAASEALFAAQVEEYLSTGKLVCVSEGPVNREPWFVYQGFQIGKDQDPWTFETLNPSPRFKTKGFIRAVDMLNSKAAFLWNVYRPGEYNDLLVAQVTGINRIRAYNRRSIVGNGNVNCALAVKDAVGDGVFNRVGARYVGANRRVRQVTSAGIQIQGATEATIAVQRPGQRIRAAVIGRRKVDIEYIQPVN